MKKSLPAQAGSKYQNQIHLLKLIATTPTVSRAELARMTNLTKATISKLTQELLAAGYVEEREDPAFDTTTVLGRRPVLLDIAAQAPIICGMLIKRGLCSVILADLKGHILEQASRQFTSLTSEELVAILMELYHEVTMGISRTILAVGISSIGPVDIVSQRILNPPFFYGITNLDLPQVISQRIGLPVFIINDANAGALAEKLYGNGKRYGNFIYLHIMNGIGTGYILDGHIYNGDFGQSGEIGHTSINFSGPLCDCGNHGCLDLYANMKSLNEKIVQLKQVYAGRSLLPKLQPDEQYSWEQIVTLADRGDPIAFAALDNFCGYISHALTNTINLLDLGHIFVGYDSGPEVHVVETLLEAKLNAQCLVHKYRHVEVKKSVFGGEAPLIGSIALISDKIFHGEIPLHFI